MQTSYALSAASTTYTGTVCTKLIAPSGSNEGCQQKLQYQLLQNAAATHEYTHCCVNLGVLIMGCKKDLM